MICRCWYLVCGKINRIFKVKECNLENMRLEEKTKAFIRQHQLFERGAGIIIGFSGGADSVALLNILYELAQAMELRLAAVHVHHGIRQEAEEDAIFCEKMCRERQIPFYCKYVNVPKMAEKLHLTEEEAGRKARYDTFEAYRISLGMDHIAVAHHQNDQAETMLFQLFRGSGLRGLAGIPVKRGTVIRPLLGVTRVEIEAYLEQRGLAYVTDKTNESDVYTRNKIRHHIIPQAEQITSGAVGHMGQASEQLREVLDYMTLQARAFLDKHGAYKKGEFVLTLTEFEQQHIALQKMIVMEGVLLLAGSRKDITQRHIASILHLAGKEGEKRVHLPGEMVVVKSYDKLVFRRKAQIPESGVSDAVKVEPNAVYTLPDGRVLETKLLEGENLENIPENDCTKWFDYDKITGTLFLRNREQGDYLTIRDDGARKSLKEYLINEKIPREARDTLLVLAEGKHIVWVLEKRMSAYYKITAHTQKILQVHIGGENHVEKD